MRSCKNEVTLKILKDLNEQQKVAVEFNSAPNMIVAGAGSGKTRVLTYKIAYLLFLKSDR